MQSAAVIAWSRLIHEHSNLTLRTIHDRPSVVSLRCHFGWSLLLLLRAWLPSLPHARRSQVLQEPVAGALEGVHDLGRHLGVLVVAAHCPAVVRALEQLRAQVYRVCQQQKQDCT